jgi:predicted nucleic acid-binding protein
MRRFRVYVDTSVIGGCFDPEFAEWSRLLFEDFRRGRLVAVVSDIVTSEVEDAPPRVRRLYAEMRTDYAEFVASGPGAIELARAYCDAGVLRERDWDDALHIAIATIAAVDALVSWNFRHVVRLDRIERVNEVNTRLGFPRIAIGSPREVTFHGED